MYGKDGVYVKTMDSSFTDEKEYFELVNGSYVKTSDEAMMPGKDYYDETVAPVDGRLPLPDEIKTLFAAG